MNVLEMEKRLNLLDTPVQLDLTLNDLRIIVTSFRALLYMMQRDGESYLNTECLDLKDELERRYRAVLMDLGLVEEEKK